MPTPAPAMNNRANERPEDGDFKSELLALIPFLRAFARSLTGNQENADESKDDSDNCACRPSFRRGRSRGAA